LHRGARLSDGGASASWCAWMGQICVGMTIDGNSPVPRLVMAACARDMSMPVVAKVRRSMARARSCTSWGKTRPDIARTSCARSSTGWWLGFGSLSVNWSGRRSGGHKPASARDSDRAAKGGWRAGLSRAAGRQRSHRTAGCARDRKLSALWRAARARGMGGCVGL
jgi:hypothetical protein